MIYLLVLLYMFMGVGTVADCFMNVRTSMCQAQRIHGGEVQTPTVQLTGCRKDHQQEEAVDATLAAWFACDFGAAALHQGIQPIDGNAYSISIF